MKKTLIYYKDEYIDLANRIRDNYLAHNHEADIICEDEQDDVEYAREMQYGEAIFIEDENTVIIHDIKTWYTNRCDVGEVFYKDSV